MGIYTEKSVEVETVDNGWVLTWTDETKREHGRDFSGIRMYEQKPKTRGRELFTNEKKLIERIKQLL